MLSNKTQEEFFKRTTAELTTAVQKYSAKKATTVDKLIEALCKLNVRSKFNLHIKEDVATTLLQLDVLTEDGFLSLTKEALAKRSPDILKAIGNLMVSVMNRASAAQSVEVVNLEADMDTGGLSPCVSGTISSSRPPV